MKYFLIAGEASGDLHGSMLIKAINEVDPEAEFNFWGGDLMQQQANGLLMHYSQTAIMGFVEVLLKANAIRNLFKTCKQQILSFNPHVVIFIDYPGFNLRMAKFCKLNGFKTAYYIAPKVWAWKENRAKALEKYIDELLLIFPFETEYFKKWQVKSTYVGNAMAESILNYNGEKLVQPKPYICLLPGSRKQEIKNTLPAMLEAVKDLNEYDIVIAGAPSLKESIYTPYLQHNVKIYFSKTYAILAGATAAIVCSGTATLETALFNVPQICGYKANPISMAIAKLLVKIKYISLVNLTLNKAAIPELIQADFNVKRIKSELEKILPNGESREQQLNDYKTLAQQFNKLNAATQAAQIINQLALK